MRVRNNYLERKSAGSCTKRKTKSKIYENKKWRNWWIIKESPRGYGILRINGITFPKYYIGKKIKFKIEVIE